MTPRHVPSARQGLYGLFLVAFGSDLCVKVGEPPKMGGLPLVSTAINPTKRTLHKTETNPPTYPHIPISHIPYPRTNLPFSHIPINPPKDTLTETCVRSPPTTGTSPRRSSLMACVVQARGVFCGPGVATHGRTPETGVTGFPKSKVSQFTGGFDSTDILQHS